MTSASVGERPAVVVGVDGSAASQRAVYVAAWEAQQRDACLIIAHAYPLNPFTWYDLVPAPQGTWADPQVQARTLVDEMRAQVLVAHPGLTVETRLHADTGAHALITESSPTTTLLVAVGARGRGGFAGLAVGSVAMQTATHANAPVLVVRYADHAGGEGDAAVDVDPGREAARASTDVHSGPVIAGVDGSPHGEPTLQLAFEEARMRRLPLVVVHVYSPAHDGTLRPGDLGRRGMTRRLETAQHMLDELVARWSEKYPDVRVQRRAVLGESPSYELIQAGRSASLVVVGSHGRGGFAGMLLGSVSRDLVEHCPTSVLVVRSRPTR